jgi:chitin disaccharide deacetylase
MGGTQLMSSFNKAVVQERRAIEFLFINADDLGIRGDINQAIVDSIMAGHCHQASIMANMDGFEDACELVHKNGLVDYIGTHLVLTEGCPLTDGIKRCRRFCNADGVFVLQRGSRIVRLTPSEHHAIAAELEAQIVRCRARGLPALRVDSHHHVHEEWGLAGLVMEVCKAEGVRWLRLVRNIGRSTGIIKEGYRRVINCRISKAGLAAVDCFGSACDYIYAVKNGQVRLGLDRVEIMVHPKPGVGGIPADGDISMAELDQHIRLSARF